MTLKQNKDKFNNYIANISTCTLYITSAASYSNRRFNFLESRQMWKRDLYMSYDINYNCLDLNSKYYFPFQFAIQIVTWKYESNVWSVEFQLIFY